MHGLDTSNVSSRVESSQVEFEPYWYSNQQVCARWLNCLSSSFRIGNGTRQGGMLSPTLLGRYIRHLLGQLANSYVGCNVGGLFVNVLAYADDIVLFAPSWNALQQLLIILEQHIADIDMECNIKKTVCMIFEARNKTKRMTVTFPKFTFDGNSLQYVKTFEYLGHIITDTFSDDDDIHREVRNMFIRTNILTRRFAKCSVDVKIILFRAYCICLYDAGLWSRYKVGSFNKRLSCYNKCFKMFFGFTRRDSVTQILFDLGLPSFNTIMHNSMVVFSRSFCSCSNAIVRHFNFIL